MNIKISESAYELLNGFNKKYGHIEENKMLANGNEGIKYLLENIDDKLIEILIISFYKIGYNDGLDKITVKKKVRI